MPILYNTLQHVFIAVLLLLPSFESDARNNQQCARLTIAGAQSWYPFSYVQPGDTSYSGVLKTKLKAQTDKQNIRLKHWTELPWKRAEINLEKGNIDILLGAFYTPERAKKWYFSSPLASSELVLFSLKETKDVTSLAQIYNKDVAYPYGMATGKKFSAITSKIKTEHIIHHEQIYGMLLKKHADFGLLPKLAVKTYLQNHLLKDKFKVHPVELDTQKVYLVTAKSNPCLKTIKTIFNHLS
ncbi:transporter substrate-binding domain-containing protein [Pseudoalteromonas sp. C2R02]|uniref:substrate-binding periplasmic protein n=1 Tax=Pseudoalteromonas sp. C2R02 TaxID=2841565 RepID=UPI001C0962A6|nr:transporter substrate-binding domain-containing protein [Pseudoalteromonas sp. C2R02]MBU2968213.1 transporter substrate-binding domain-containing protein [Pseudoalteromonas sp. C2R02]